MFCTNCGTNLGEGDAFCSRCGKPMSASSTAAPPPPPKRLVRLMSDKKIAGVCSGVAAYLGVDVTMVRVLWLLLAILTIVPGFLAYLIGWIAMPKEYGSQPAAGPSVAART